MRWRRVSLNSERESTGVPEKGRRVRLLGWAILAVSVVLWTAVVVVPFLPLSGAQKIWAAGALAVAGEVAFWISAAVLGREAVRRYRGSLNPRNWFGKRR